MFPKFIVTTLSVTLFCLVQVTLASLRQCKDATYSIADRVLVGHALLTETCPSIGDCVALCVERDPLCESVNYYRKTKICELNDKTEDSNPDDMVDFEWAIYMTNSVRLLSCNNSDLECGRQTDICHLEIGGNKCKGISRQHRDEHSGFSRVSTAYQSSFCENLATNLVWSHLYESRAVRLFT
ncbi:hypothetical protein ACROYT_G015877 [Oculina patagonica]